MQAELCLVEEFVKVTVEDRLAEVERIRLARLASRRGFDEPGAPSAVVRRAVSAALRRIGAARAGLCARRGPEARAPKRTGML